MSINNDDVEKIAHLARLAIDPAQLETYTRTLSEILRPGRTNERSRY